MTSWCVSPLHHLLSPLLHPLSSFSLSLFFAAQRPPAFRCWSSPQSSTPGEGPPLHVVTEGGITSVKGLSQVAVGTEEEALSMFFQGETMRSTAEHVLNAFSSRSHW